MRDRRGVLSARSFRDVRGESITGVSSSCSLVCLSILYAALERKVSESSDQRIHQVLGKDWQRGPSLFREMQRLLVAECPMILPAIRAALRLAAEVIIKEPHSLRSICLLGYFYAFERFQIDTGFYDDFLIKENYYFQTRDRWKHFNDRFDAVLLDDEEGDQICRSINSAFNRLETLLAAVLHYETDQLRFHITAVNPEAGSHSMPQDPAEIRVALLAGMSAYRKFPYLRERFGERGERFTASDSCWLFSLIPFSFERIQENISWLQVVLAKRGLPSILLESHLEEIIRICKETFPEEKEGIEKVAKIVLKLEFDRSQVLEQEWFDGHRDKELESIRLGKFGPVTALLASAWVDEMTGIQGAFQIVQNWFISPIRFNQEWISRVNLIIGEIIAKRVSPIIPLNRIIPEPPLFKRGIHD